MGRTVEGRTLGHLHNPDGLFLYPPDDKGGSTVTRLFVPAEQIDRWDLQSGTTAPPPPAKPPRSRRERDPLLDRPIDSADQLMAALAAQSRMPILRIGEALVELKLLTQEELSDALAEQAGDHTMPLGQLLIDSGRVTPPQLQSALVRKMGYPAVDVTRFAAEVLALQKVPYAMARRLRVLPLLIRNGRLIVAMEDPTARDALDELEFSAQCKVVPVVAPVGTLAFGQREAYTRIGDVSAAPDVETVAAERLVETLERESHGYDELDDHVIEQSDNSLVRLINSMILEAHARGVSDIHIECQPGLEKVQVRFRRDGVMSPYLELPPTYRHAVVARIKVMCDLDISEKRKPQDGKINFARFSPQHRLELRVATIPTTHGLEDVVLRLLASSKPLEMDHLGLSPANHQALDQIIHRPYGMVLCVGPTGSGKTTTLHSVLARINTPERKIWTAEDPVEITQRGLRQVQVNPRIDWTFAKALRAFLRADPDVIMVGEVRDQETAEIAIEASLTGHLVFSTLHTNSAAETVTRLLDMGCDPFGFADSLLGILAQRLVRSLCPHCRTQRPLTEDEQEALLDEYLRPLPTRQRPNRHELLAQWTEQFGRGGPLQHYESTGCPRCAQTGLMGRMGVHELMIVSPQIRHLVQTGARADELLRHALSEGLHTLRQDGVLKVLQGLTPLSEVRANT
ncbi:Flp pilus assembly complex ATPase component TadA [Inhella sp. 4Y17]|uniref:Flp pilus assembly complex ATPase component TadA n=2 Tax=Inhella gelatinilytica TaxID=2795030 RepID=A0A931ISV5_9BURK|nr:Flp pilus assembly complex ATPase component TadA [Inhella gelatinilytica]